MKRLVSSITVLFLLIVPVVASSGISDPYQDTDWLESPLYKTLELLNGRKADFLVDGIYDCDDWAVMWLTDHHMMKGTALVDLFVVCAMAKDGENSHALACSRFYYDDNPFYLVMDPQSGIYLICTDIPSAKKAAAILTAHVYDGDIDDYEVDLNRFAPYYKLMFHYNRYEDVLEED